MVQHRIMVIHVYINTHTHLFSSMSMMSRLAQAESGRSHGKKMWIMHSYIVYTSNQQMYVCNVSIRVYIHMRVHTLILNRYVHLLLYIYICIHICRLVDIHVRFMCTYFLLLHHRFQYICMGHIYTSCSSICSTIVCVRHVSHSHTHIITHHFHIQV